MSAPLDQGETYQYRHTVLDASGAPANAGSLPAGVTVTITLPDGTTANPTVVSTATGLYDFDYATTQVGRHYVVGTATGGTLGTAVEKFEDVFHVEPAGRLLVGFDDARTNLRGTLTITSLADREQLRWLILAASDAAERALGRIICRQSITDYFDGENQPDITLRRIPLYHPDGFVTITTVTESGVTLTGSDYVIRRAGGWQLRRGTTTQARPWQVGTDNIVVTYTAGSTQVPAVLRQAVLNIIERAWQTTQQMSHPALDDSVQIQVPSAIGALSGPMRTAWDSLIAVGV
jgi:hypothetical protein